MTRTEFKNYLTEAIYDQDRKVNLVAKIGNKETVSLYFVGNISNITSDDKSITVTGKDGSSVNEITVTCPYSKGSIEVDEKFKIFVVNEDRHNILYFSIHKKSI